MTMISLMLVALLLVSESEVQRQAFGDRDKSGTRRARSAEAESQAQNAKEPACAGSFGAEREGFEPSVRLPVHRFSRPAHSTTLAPLRIAVAVLWPPSAADYPP